MLCNLDILKLNPIDCPAHIFRHCLISSIISFASNSFVPLAYRRIGCTGLRCLCALRHRRRVGGVGMLRRLPLVSLFIWNNPHWLKSILIARTHCNPPATIELQFGASIGVVAQSRKCLQRCAGVNEAVSICYSHSLSASKN